MTNERQNDTRPAHGWKSNLIEKAIQLGCKQIYRNNPFSTMGQRNKWHYIVKILKQYILKKIETDQFCCIFFFQRRRHFIDKVYDHGPSGHQEWPSRTNFGVSPRGSNLSTSSMLESGSNSDKLPEQQNIVLIF